MALIADNTYQVIGEDGVLPQGDVVLTVEQLDQLANISGKKAVVSLRSMHLLKP